MLYIFYILSLQGVATFGIMDAICNPFIKDEQKVAAAKNGVYSGFTGIFQ